jgi:hypothetical protein
MVILLKHYRGFGTRMSENSLSLRERGGVRVLKITF